MKEVAFFTFKNNKQTTFFNDHFLMFCIIPPSIFNIPKATIYKNQCYKDSAGLNRFALAALERELWPRRPVHFFMHHPLLLTTETTLLVTLYEILESMKIWQKTPENAKTPGKQRYQGKVENVSHGRPPPLVVVSWKTNIEMVGATVLARQRLLSKTKNSHISWQIMLSLRAKTYAD